MSDLGRNTVQSKAQDHLFSRVSTSNAAEYSTLSVPEEWHGTVDSGYLIPFMAKEVLPGEYMKLNTRILVRTASPMLVPIMENLYVNYEFFYVKNRMIYDKWRNLMGETRNPNDSTDYQVPVLNSGSKGVERRSIFDCLGINYGVPNVEFSSLPLRAYNLIYNEWYRDENLQEWQNVGGTGTSTNPVDEFGETDQLSNYKLLKRNKSHDYFTSMLPWQQKGDPVVINLSGDAPVKYNMDTNRRQLVRYPDPSSTGYKNGIISVNPSSDNTTGLSTIPPYSTGDGNTRHGLLGTQGVGATIWDDPYEGTQHGTPSAVTSNWYLSNIDPNGTLYSDLSNVLGISISDFRTAIQLQAIKELDARGGTRYNEKIWNEFRVKIADAELHRPELLASYRQAFYTTPIAQTSATTNALDETAQGNLSAVSHAYVDRGYDFVKGFDDHGFVIGILSITSDNSYQQGLHKKWSRKSRFDYFTPLLQNISEQAVLRKELIVQGNDVVDDDGQPVDNQTLGFQEAWAEYKYGEKLITGDFRSNPNNPSVSLDRWHLSPYLDPKTTKLNSEFIEYNIPVDRTLAITGTTENPQPQFLCDVYSNAFSTKPMAVYNVPAYLGMRF